MHLQWTENTTEKQKQSKCKVVNPGLSGDPQNTPKLKTQGTFQKNWQKNCKNHRNRAFVVRLCPSNIKSYTHKPSPTRLSKHELNKNNTNEDAKVGRKNQ